MDIEVLRVGSVGNTVRIWQTFLKTHGYQVSVDGNFGHKTKKVTEGFQRDNNIHIDGTVGPATWGVALWMGFVPDAANHIESGLARIKVPEGIRPIPAPKRNQVFGQIKFRSAHTKKNPEAIAITNDWQAKSLVRVKLPGNLSHVVGMPKSQSIFWHKEFVSNIVGLFTELNTSGMNKQILTWAGSWAPRLVRGSESTLSSHAWATAFDINTLQNMLGHNPTKRGEWGSVVDIVPIAVKYGFWWGGWGWGPGTRLDGMHFEIGAPC